MILPRLISFWANGKNSFGHFVEVAPTSCKKALTGSGKASKDEMVDALRDYPGSPLGLTKANREAIADALGAALAGADKWLAGSDK